MLETIIVIAVIALAAAYVARTFYRKFGRGKSRSSDCGCSGCDCGTQENCQSLQIEGRPPDECPAKNES